MRAPSAPAIRPRSSRRRGVVMGEVLRNESRGKGKTGVRRVWSRGVRKEGRWSGRGGAQVE